MQGECVLTLNDNQPLISVDRQLVEDNTRAGFWRTETLTDTIRLNAARNPQGLAFREGDHELSWELYDELSDCLAGDLIAAGLPRGARIAVMLPDGPGVHVAFTAGEKAGLTIVGIGARAGDKEIEHLLRKCGATALMTETVHAGRPMHELVALMRSKGIPVAAHITVDRMGHGPGNGGRPLELIAARRLGPNDLWLLNSTSGTTGLPKCVMQFQNRWWYFHRLAMETGALNKDDKFLSLVPAPFGFSLWTTHFTPCLLCAPTIVVSRFDAESTLDIIERQKPTVISCVSTQFIMLLNAQAQKRRDLSSLRVMFTGGESVPYDRAAEFEEETGARVLQFYGSNETGALSGTSMRDTREQRLTTCGRIIESLQVRLLDDEGKDVLPGQPGQPACKGPVTCMGYYDDEAANAELFTVDGWMTTGDIAHIDADGYLRLAGRKSDFIIRGGKNISALAVEEAVALHPSVAMAAAIAMPDKVFGERVCCYLVLRPGAALALPELAAFLRERGISKENFPERLMFLDALPMSPIGKVAKTELRADIRRRLVEDPVTDERSPCG
jgi:acyl-CoA synthetase